MKTLGLLGGMSWHSTVIYYRTINEMVNRRLGDWHSSKLLLYSVDLEECRLLMMSNDWHGLEKILSPVAVKLQDAGADCIVMCTNTPHMIADAIREKIKIPLLHIAEETAKEIGKQKITTAALLGTKITMEESFFRSRLEQFGIKAMIPGDADRDYIHASILNELTKGIINDETRKKYLDIIGRLKAGGAGGIIFGCTEISLLFRPEDCGLPVFDTTLIHAQSAVDFALAPETVAA